MKRKPPLTDKQKQEIVDLYLTGKYNCKELGDMYSRNNNSILGLLKRRGIKINNNQSLLQRKYKVNEDFFDIIDTEEKAYILGFLYADGYNSESTNKVIINLANKDKEILLKIKNAMGLECPIKSSPYKRGLNTWRLIICNKHISKRLALLGCHQAKTFSLRFPDEGIIPTHLLNHFIRGYFDGDGCLSIYESRLSVNIVTATNFANGLKSMTENVVGVRSQIINNKRLSSGLKNWVMGGTQQIVKFLKWMYQDATLFMDRKHQKYLEALARFPKIRRDYRLR